MTKLVITRGLPASGKSTWARAWVKEDPLHRAEVNRDHLRLMMHGGYAKAEVQVNVARDAMIRDLLAQNVSVVCSDTNLPQRVARELASIGRRARAEVEVIDLTDIPLEVCLERNAGRTGHEHVPIARIREMHERYIASNGYPLPLPAEDEYHGVPNFVKHIPGLPTIVLCDVDGTVALKGARSPFDESRVHEDRPNEDVCGVVARLQQHGPIIFMSGRSENCREVTEEWLSMRVTRPFMALYMRPAGDRRKDSVVKRELFDKHIRGRYNVLCVLDDRDQVVRMWREELGLTCLQVAEGNF